MSLGTIDISLTTISSRIATLDKTLRSLLDQHYRDLRVIVHLSHEAYLLDEGVSQLPPALEALRREAGERLEFVWCANTGPYRKLLPYLHRYWGSSRLVVTADDDTIYPPDWLDQLAQGYRQFQCSIAYRGHRMLHQNGSFAPYRRWMLSRIEENPSHFILPTGKDGILYDTAFFPAHVLNIEAAIAVAPTADDLWFRWCLALNGVPVHVLNSDYRASFTESDYASSLYLNFNRGGGNDAAIARLQTHFRDTFYFDYLAGTASEEVDVEVLA